LIASASFEYTRYVSGRINSIDQKRGTANNKEPQAKDYVGVKPANLKEATDAKIKTEPWSGKTRSEFGSVTFDAKTANNFTAGEKTDK